MADQANKCDSRGRALAYQTPHLDQPRLQLVVDDDVVPVALEAVLVVVHHRLGRTGDWVRGRELYFRCKDTVTQRGSVWLNHRNINTPEGTAVITQLTCGDLKRK